MRKVLIYSTVLATLLLSACALYKIDVPQGNIIEPEEAAKLRPGLTRRQVQFLLGTPAITDPFHQERWDYVYFFKPGRGEVEKHNLSVIFEGDRVSRIEGEVPDMETVDKDLETLRAEKERGAAAEEDMPGGQREEFESIFDEPLD